MICIIQEKSTSARYHTILILKVQADKKVDQLFEAKLFLGYVEADILNCFSHSYNLLIEFDNQLNFSMTNETTCQNQVVLVLQRN